MSSGHSALPAQPASGRNRRRSARPIRKIKQLVFKYREHEAGEVTLGQRRVYIIPTKPGLVFAVLMAIMMLGSINYALNLGFALTFMLAGAAIVGMYISHANLAGLRLRTAKADSVFAGEIAHFQVVLDNPSKRDRMALVVRLTGLDEGRFNDVIVDVNGQSSKVVALACQSKQRGWLACPRIRLGTIFPLGLWRVWSYWHPALNCLVYPAPEIDPPPLPWAGNGEGDANGESGEENLAGIRPYQSGDSARQIAWKALARNDQLASRHFQGGEATELWLDWYEIAGLSHEDRIARLTAWVLLADSQRLAYGLRLPQQEVLPDSSAEHFVTCLERLALC